MRDAIILSGISLPTTTVSSLGLTELHGISVISGGSGATITMTDGASRTYINKTLPALTAWGVDVSDLPWSARTTLTITGTTAYDLVGVVPQ